MPTIERRRVHQYPSRAHPSGLSPSELRVVAVLGAILQVAAAVFVWIAVVSTANGSGGLVSSWQGLCGLVLAGLGALLWLPLRGKRRRAAVPLAGPNPRLAPWQEDHAWDLRSVGSDEDRWQWRQAGRMLGLLAFLSVWFSLFFLFAEPDVDLWSVDLWPAVLIPGIGFVAISRNLLSALAWVAKFSPSRLRFARCPFRLGEELVVGFQDLDRLKEARSVTATLRFFAEELEWRNSLNCYWIRYAHFEEVRTFAPEALAFGTGAPSRLLRLARPAGPQAELLLRFDLPAHPRFETRLAENPVQYWELEVKAELPGIDYVGVFLLPVYK